MLVANLYWEIFRVWTKKTDVITPYDASSHDPLYISPHEALSANQGSVYRWIMAEKA